MSEKLRECPFCGNKDVILSDYRLVGNATCWRITCRHCRLVMSGANKQLLLNLWNRRTTEDALKAELEELRYIVKQFEQWRGDDDTGCPKYQHPDYPCPGEKEFKKKFGEDADFDNIECDEWGEGCWVEYYRWKFRQKNNATDTGKGGEDE